MSLSFQQLFQSLQIYCSRLQSGRILGLFVQALYLAIESLLANSSRAIEMGKEGRKRAIEMFTIDRNVSQYEDLYIQMGVSQ